MGHAHAVSQILNSQSLASIKRDMIEVIATKTVMELDTSTSLASSAATRPQQRATANTRADNLPVQEVRFEATPGSCSLY